MYLSVCSAPMQLFSGTVNCQRQWWIRSSLVEDLLFIRLFDLLCCDVEFMTAWVCSRRGSILSRFSKLAMFFHFVIDVVFNCRCRLHCHLFSFLFGNANATNVRKFSRRCHPLRNRMQVERMIGKSQSRWIIFTCLIHSFIHWLNLKSFNLEIVQNKMCWTGHCHRASHLRCLRRWVPRLRRRRRTNARWRRLTHRSSRASLAWRPRRDSPHPFTSTSVALSIRPL